MGGKFHLKLNIVSKPIAYKYRKGKVKRTLKRELKVLETAKSQGIRTVGSGHYIMLALVKGFHLWIPPLMGLGPFVPKKLVLASM